MASDPEGDGVELLIVGAGWHGLVMAKTYHELYPNASILILDSSSSLGGSWAAERLYPGLKTNNLIGSYEFSDFPMTPAAYGLHLGDHIPGSVVHQYLRDAAAHFDIDRFLRLETRIVAASMQNDGGWIVESSSPAAGPPHSSRMIRAAKLVVATGLTSEPSIPTFPGQDMFRGLLIHSRELKSRAMDLRDASNVVVIGANKSAWDVGYSVASSSRQAHMVIRPGGGGPSWVWPAVFTPFKLSLPKMSKTRFLSLFDPWPFDMPGVASWIRWALHSTALGRVLVRLYWSVLDSCVRRVNRYCANANTRMLQPWASTFWMGNSLSTHNYETSFFDLVRDGKVKVHSACVERLTPTEVRLDNGSAILADAVVCCTGWRVEPSLRLFRLSESGRTELELNRPISTYLRQEAQDQISAKIPMLQSQRSRTEISDSYKGPVSDEGYSFRLYRFVAPSHEDLIRAKSLAFIGMYQSLHTVALAQAQALWISAYLNDEIDQLQRRNFDLRQIEQSTILQSEYERLRRPKQKGGSGAKFPDLVFDSVPYIDQLLTDLGLRTRRKRSFFAEWFLPYTMADYADLSEEWRQTRARTR